MQTPRDVLTPDALSMLQTIASTGSFAAAARQMGMVPSALTYRVRQIEDALDVLLFDRSSRQAKMTAAGSELLSEGARLLGEIDAVANRVKRVATGWESRFTIALDTIVSKTTMMELCDAFYALNPPTQIRLRDETLSGTLEALTSGQADLAIGTGPDSSNVSGLQSKPLGTAHFIFAIAPHHPLAKAKEPLSDAVIQQHRAVAVADSVQRGSGQTFGIFSGQEVFTVASMRDKLDAQLRGLGVGHLPAGMATRYLESGRLVFKQTERAKRLVTVHYAWRQTKNQSQGRAMQWWLSQLESATTRNALLENHASY
jgi:DNA-binding transcriptional LysR family regulator